jgi:hypothetical protein
MSSLIIPLLLVITLESIGMIYDECEASDYVETANTYNYRALSARLRISDSVVLAVRQSARPQHSPWQLPQIMRQSAPDLFLY